MDVINLETVRFEIVRIDYLLDIHFVTDEDIAKHNSYAIKIGAVTDAARPLATGTALKAKR